MWNWIRALFAGDRFGPHLKRYRQKRGYQPSDVMPGVFYSALSATQLQQFIDLTAEDEGAEDGSEDPESPDNVAAEFELAVTLSAWLFQNTLCNRRGRRFTDYQTVEQVRTIDLEVLIALTAEMQSAFSAIPKSIDESREAAGPVADNEGPHAG